MRPLHNILLLLLVPRLLLPKILLPKIHIFASCLQGLQGGRCNVQGAMNAQFQWNL
jgi:hypothetical protein